MKFLTLAFVINFIIACWPTVNIISIIWSRYYNFIISCKKLVEALLTETNNIVLIGDFNINLLKTCSNDFKTFMDAYNLKCLVKQPTCYKSQCPSLVDLILVTNPKYFSKSVNFDCGLSDFHNIICTATKLHVTRRCKRKIKYRSFKHFNGSLYKNSLLHAPFQVAEIFDHIDNTTWFQNRLLEEIINEHAPMKLRVLPKKPIVYMNSTLRKALFKKRQMYGRYRNSKSSRNWEKYRKARNDFINTKRNSVKNYFKDRCENGPRNRGFWQTIKPFLSKDRATQPTFVEDSDQVLTDPEDICNKFNEYFINVTNEVPCPPKNIQFVANLEHTCNFPHKHLNFENIIKSYEHHPSILAIKSSIMSSVRQESIDLFQFTPVSEDLVTRKLQKLNVRKSCGFDNIPAIFLVKGSSELAPHVTFSINKCIRDMHFPHDLKLAEVSPIHKKGDIQKIQNYRPVSILTSMSKVY